MMLFKSLLPILALSSFVAAQDPSSTDASAASNTDGSSVDPSSTDNSGDVSASASDTGSTDPSATDSSTDASASASDTGSQDVSASASGSDSAASASSTDNSGSGGGADAPLPKSEGQAGITPSNPTGDTVVKANELIYIQWSDAGGSWDNMTIDLMTGSNEDVKSVVTVADGIDATTDTSYTWNVPLVYPYAKVWFFRFTNGGQATPAAFTVRFTIAGPDGSTIPPPLTETVSGTEIGYVQNGRLDTSSGTSQTNTGKATATGQSGNGVTIYTAGINTGTDLPQGIKTTGIKAATDHAVDPSSSGKRLLPALAMLGAGVVGAAFIMA